MIDKILADTTHGSLHIAFQLLEYISNNPEDTEALGRIEHKFADMALLRNICKTLRKSKNRRTAAMTLYRNLKAEVATLVNKLSSHIPPGASVLTFSHSQTVEMVLNSMEIGKIYCPHSLPGGEGKYMAKRVSGTLIEDNEIKTYIPRVDVVCLGCDQYNEEQFVNKYGTAKIVDLATRAGKPVYVLTNSLKYARPLLPLRNPMLEVICVTENTTFIVADQAHES